MDCAIEINGSDIINYIEMNNPDLVINERSSGFDIQNKITKYCNEKNIMNFAILDVHGGYNFCP